MLLVGCAEPEQPTDVEPEPTISEVPIEEPDEAGELLDELGDLHATLTEIRDALVDVEEAPSLEQAHASADRALARLLAGGLPAAPPASDEGSDATSEDDAGNDDSDEAADDGAEAAGADRDGPPALLPSETVERTGSASAPDLLSAMLSLAQDVGGELGPQVSEVLRDPIAGDLGAWQRDAAGMVELARSAATSSTDVARLETAILELEGEGTRALAWTFVAREAEELSLAQAAAERALAHVQLMTLAVEDIGGSS